MSNPASNRLQEELSHSSVVQPSFLLYVGLMKGHIITVGLFCLAMSLVESNAAWANSLVKIDTLPTEYIPINSPTNREPLSLAGFHFEVNLETQRARVVADYTYPDFMIYEPNDPTKGPRSTIAQIPGLKYDAAKHEVVFESQGTRTVCATVTEQSGIFGRHTKVRNTGACRVVTDITQQTEDDGWSIHHFPVLNAYFEAP